MRHIDHDPQDGTPHIPLCGRADWDELVTLTYLSDCWECLSILGIDIDDRHDQPQPDIDYEPAGCPICGGTSDPSEHIDCLEQLGTYPEPKYGEE